MVIITHINEILFYAFMCLIAKEPDLLYMIYLLEKRSYFLQNCLSQCHINSLSFLRLREKTFMVINVLKTTPSAIASFTNRILHFLLKGNGLLTAKRCVKFRINFDKNVFLSLNLTVCKKQTNSL